MPKKGLSTTVAIPEADAPVNGKGSQGLGGLTEEAAIELDSEPKQTKPTWYFGPSRSNPLRPSGFGGKVFDFLSSLKLAVILLVTLGIVCSIGTVQESMYTARWAKRVIYGTAWFDLLLASIFVSVVFATLSRYPWRLAQVGWLITHLGVLTVLLGSLISHRLGIEGQMTLFEGQANDAMQLDRSFIRVRKANDSLSQLFEAAEVEWGRPSPENPQVYQMDQVGVDLTVDGFRADTEIVQNWLNDSQIPNPAVHFAIESNFAGKMASGWLAPHEKDFASKDLGPARIVCREIADETALASELSPPSSGSTQGTIRFDFQSEGRMEMIDVAAALEEKIPLQGSDYSVRVTRQFNAGYLNEDQELEDQPHRAPNPLVEFNVYKGAELVFEHIIEFAFFPDFDTLHGRGDQLPFDVTYVPGIPNPRDKAEFAILVGPAEQLHWKVTSAAGDISAGTIEVGTPVPMPLMTAGMALLIDKFLPNARLAERLVEKPIKKGEFRNSAAHIALSDAQGNSETFWMRKMNEEVVKLGDVTYSVSYMPETVPIGFSIRLDDFRLQHYPGSGDRPMSYESDVLVTDSRGRETLTRDITILMNEPLDHGGYRVFQSSFHDIPEGDPKISVFSIASDPGVLIIYTGVFMLVGGMIAMFYFRPYLARLERRWKIRGQEAAAT